MASDLTSPRDYRSLSLWWDRVNGPLKSRPSLTGDIDVDVAIIGAGFTGLWTARSLLVADPTLRIAVLEQEVAGFGASGRNGGWCSALFAASDARLTRDHGADAARRMRRAMQDTVDEVGRQAKEDGIECHFEKGGTVVAARSAVQVARARAEIATARDYGASETDLRWLDAGEATDLLGASGVLGATFTPHCAVLQPALLARGLADAVEQRGAKLYEHTRVRSYEGRHNGQRAIVQTEVATVRADVVVRATEGWTSNLPRSRRALVPIYSLMVATEPLGASFWAQAGLKSRPTFSDQRHMIIYGQRTDDDRLAFGGRGAPYHFHSRVKDAYDRDDSVHAVLRETLIELFPDLRAAQFTHAWGGPLGVPRDWYSSVGFNPSSGLAWAGGYVGDGVSTTNLAGRTLADLILGRSTELVDLPWVGHASPTWEPEPFRWIGVNAGLWAMKSADRSEELRGKPSWLAEKMGGLLGH